MRDTYEQDEDRINRARLAMLRQLWQAMYDEDISAMPYSPQEVWHRLLIEITAQRQLWEKPDFRTIWTWDQPWLEEVDA
jgi:hypothetical protein